MSLQRVIAFPHTAPLLAPAAVPVPRTPVITLAADERFAELGTAKRVWAIGALQGDQNKLSDIHDVIAANIKVGDRLVYLGNYLGSATSDADNTAVDDILAFRRFALAIPGTKPEDIVFLRGCMEEMWQKLLTMQFCPNPAEVLDWMEGFGIDNVLQVYGSTIAEARIYLRDRPMGMTKWTNRLRAARRAKPGHEVFSTVVKRAAFTRKDTGQVGPMLFVHAGLDPRLGLTQQNDNFWWGWRHLAKLDADGYGPYTRIVRGFAPSGPAPSSDIVTCLGGDVKAVCLGQDGSVIRTVD